MTGSPQYTRDTSLNYNEDCQLYLCLLITFANTDDIPPERLSLEITALTNPVSINPAKDITVTTMMKYQADSIYYKIDTATQDTKFACTAGTILASSVTTTSLTGDTSTYADN